MLKSFFGFFKKIYFTFYLYFFLSSLVGIMLANLFETYFLIDPYWAREQIMLLEKVIKPGEKLYIPESKLKLGGVKLGLEIGEENGKPVKKILFQGDLPQNIRKNYPVFGRLMSPWIIILPIIIWLWPLYRYNFEKRDYSSIIEKRVVNFPIFIFILIWVYSLYAFSVKIFFAQKYFEVLEKRHYLVFASASFLFACFAGFLNLIFSQKYVLNIMAPPIFEKHNLYGFKQGKSVKICTRITLMVFLLSVVPLLMSVGSVVYFNYLAFAADKSSEFFNIVIPIIFMMILILIIGFIQILSVLHFKRVLQKPVNELIVKMKRVSSGDFSCKSSVLYVDEIGELKSHFNMMLDGLQEREKIKDTFGKFVSMEIAEMLMKTHKVNLEGDEVRATILFTDIRDFTPMSEKMNPAELVAFLNSYFSFQVAAVHKNKGVVNKFIGDAVMAIFSPVFGVENHAEAALQAAIDIRSGLKEFNETKQYPEVRCGIGVHTGILIAGNVGTESRMEYTVIGDTVNVASRIESKTKELGTDLLISSDVYNIIDKNHFKCISFEKCGPILLKGKSENAVLYKIQ